MDDLRNKNLKITRTTLTKEELKSVTDKVNKNNKTLKTNSNKKVRGRRSFYTSALIQGKYGSLSYIKPISKTNLDPCGSLFYTLDIETMGNSENIQHPVAISISSKNLGKIFIIKPNLKCGNKDLILSACTQTIWKEFFEFLNGMPNKTIFFVHNLGSFDGLFLYKAISLHFKPNQVKTIIDHHNKFISINLTLDNGNTITWLDSYRIFPVSLKDLCKTFKVEGKSQEYNSKFNSLELFKDKLLLKEFIEYSLQDAIALYKALEKGQEIYIDKYKVDICSIFSTSSLSLKIFRLIFQKCDIPIIKGNIDSFIRKSYFGGHTDYFGGYMKKGHYYDINSLYPYAMLKPMPHELIKHHKIDSSIDLNNFFGFILAEIEAPDTLRPLLPYKHNGKTIYPVGKWHGIYFSEELKAVSLHGYKITPIEGYEFSKINLFEGYINHFYEIKKNSFGAERFIAKMHLNQLYGIFGRRQEVIQTLNIYNKDLKNYFATRIVKNIIEINDQISTILVLGNLNYDLMKKLNITLESNYQTFNLPTKSNVAIASAVTSYARITMIPYILSGGVYYTDTDSIFTSKPLKPHLIGLDLGLMKDELNGCVIEEAYFLDIKKYGYWYLDKEGNRVEKSVIAGIPRDSITFEEIKAVYNGQELIKEVPVRFYKSFKTLDIRIDSTKVTIKRTGNKLLKNNQYIPIHINLKFLNKNEVSILPILRIIKFILGRLIQIFK